MDEQKRCPYKAVVRSGLPCTLPRYGLKSLFKQFTNLLKVEFTSFVCEVSPFGVPLCHQKLPFLRHGHEMGFFCII